MIRLAVCSKVMNGTSWYRLKNIRIAVGSEMIERVALGSKYWVCRQLGENWTAQNYSSSCLLQRAESLLEQLLRLPYVCFKRILSSNKENRTFNVFCVTKWMRIIVEMLQQINCDLIVELQQLIKGYRCLAFDPVVFGCCWIKGCQLIGFRIVSIRELVVALSLSLFLPSIVFQDYSFVLHVKMCTEFSPKLA